MLLNALLGAAILAQSLPALGDLLALSSRYVSDYERQLGSVISEETYTQTAFWEASLRRGGAVRAERKLQSQFLTVRVPGDQQHWIGIRDVLEVDGKPVEDARRELERVLPRSIRGKDELHSLADESARFNIGDISRNINVPTFGLLVLYPEYRNQFSFKKAGEENVGGARVWVVRFAERGHPTLIRGARGEDQPVEGRLWIDPRNGRVLQSELVAINAGTQMRARITVRYSKDDRLSLLVPAEMAERYETRRHWVEAKAAYSRYRRFEVEVKFR